MKLVVIGGGSGQRQVAKAFNYLSKEKLFDKIKRVSFIVAVSDNGGSTKEIRIGSETYAPGDLRNVATALFNEEDDKILNVRVKTGEDGVYHAVGNFLIEGLKKHYSDDWLKINEWFQYKKFYETNKFYVLPSTIENIDIVAYFPNGDVIIGEEEIDNYIINNLTHLEPYKISFFDRNTLKLKENVESYFLALDHLKEADLVIISPGSFYTSIMPVISQKEIEQILKTKDKYYFSNIFNYGNITYQLQLLKEKVGSYNLLYNTSLIEDRKLKEKYEREGKYFVDPSSLEEIAKMLKLNHKGYDFISEEDPTRHDPLKIKKVLEDLISY